MKSIYFRKICGLVSVLLCLTISGCRNSPNKNPVNVQHSSNSVTDISYKNKKNPLSSKVIAERSNEKINLMENDFKIFKIYSDKGNRDNHFVPSGFMPNGKCIKFDDSWERNCYEGDSCMRIVYDVECSRADQRWGGIYWLNPPNNWGYRKGGFNLTGAKRLTFWARGENGGEQIQEFTVGGISGDYPDSDIITIGPVILTDQWRKYTIDVRGKDLSYISGGFAWSTNEEVNPDGCIFYLDNIQFE